MKMDAVEEESSNSPVLEIPPEFEAIASRVSELEEQARRLIHERPVVAVLGAVGLGYLVARLVSRVGR